MKLIVRVALFFIAAAAFAQKPTRLPWQEFAKDPARLQTYRNAIATLKSRSTADPSSAEYRTSWEYWAAIHGYFGQAAQANTVANYRVAAGLTDPSYDQYFVGVRDMVPPDAVAQAVWDQCQHGTDWFFAWHRLYLFYYERVLQDAVKDTTLRLPYWDYTDTTHLGMPEEFRSPTYVNAQGQVVANPLYEGRRATGWNAPGTKGLDPTSTDIDNPLNDPLFFDTTASDGTVTTGYQNDIQGGVHGNVHCEVMDCPVTVMGAVPYSSVDPIFWLHHANIDRMWDCWTSISGHKNPSTTGFMNQPYSFVDTQGNQVTKLVKNLFDGSLIDYAYAQMTNCERAAAPVLTAVAESAPSAKSLRAARMALAKPVLIGETKGVTIGGPVVQTLVKLPATASLNHPRQFALRAQTQLPVTTELILRGVHYAEHPRTRFRIYLARRDDPSRRAVVGTLSFFGGMPGHETHAQADQRVFDATQALRALGLEGTGTLDVLVVFEAIADLRADFDPTAANLTVDEVTLQVKRDL